MQFFTWYHKILRAAAKCRRLVNYCFCDNNNNNNNNNNRDDIYGAVIESSPSSFDECRLSAEVAANPQTKPTDLDCESAGKKWQLPSASTIAIYYYSARELILILPSQGG